jgi:PTS system galactitol-specific IIC component
LLTISGAASEFTQKYMKGRKIWIGIDASTILGHPATLSSILILTPIVTFMSLIPGNQMLAVASLVAIPWFVIPMTSYAKGNVLHIVLSCIVVFAVYFWCATALAGAHTNLALITGFQLPEGAELIGSLSEGGNPITWILVKIGEMLGL